MSQVALKRAYIGLGANMGNRLSVLNRAVAELRRLPNTQVAATSHLYESKPMYVEDQPHFLNAVAQIETKLTPRELLVEAKRIEAQLGRFETFRHGPRVVDLDILYYEGEKVEDPDLIVPHVGLYSRPFVLRPLCDIDPDLFGGPLRELVPTCEGSELPTAAQCDLKQVP